MGIETYEPLADVARAFGVPNAYDGTATFVTVGNLYRYILERRRPRPPTVCPTGTVFYRLRRGLMTTAAVPRPLIRPASRGRSRQAPSEALQRPRPAFRRFAVYGLLSRAGGGVRSFGRPEGAA